MKIDPMIKYLGILLLLLAPAAGLAQTAGYFGPLITLDNGKVTLQVSPKTGRIVSYQRTGEQNWLAVTDKPPIPGFPWNPWGGDRVWPTVQSLNQQIYKSEGCDPVIDGQPWDLLSQTPASLEMRSQISPQLGLHITRRIKLVPDSTKVIHTFHLERIADSPFPVHVWTVTGIRPGNHIWIESDPAIPHPDKKPFKWWRDSAPSTEIPRASLMETTRVLQVPLPAKSLKTGTYGRWIAAVNNTSAFLQTTAYHADALYLDASNLQTYLSPQYAIYEIETLSPTWFLRKGECIEWKVQWQLLDFPSPAGTDKDKAEFLGFQLRK
ncbi:MAG: hypothetical protein ACAI35_16065 [Candidatus Methylacidiphilales bacterium]|nr:hypothetical protein [Candidatus Methylacidiphilales bacterium]